MEQGRWVRGGRRVAGRGRMRGGRQRRQRAVISDEIRATLRPCREPWSLIERGRVEGATQSAKIHSGICNANFPSCKQVRVTSLQ